MNEHFHWFGTGHVIALLVIGFAILCLYVFRRSLRHPTANRATRYALAAILGLSQISLDAWFAFGGQWTLDYNLPLQLCMIALLLSIWMLLTRNHTIFEFTFLAGMGGALQAILTPDIGMYVFPHYRVMEFFIAHGAILAACFFMVFVEGYRITLRSIWKSFLILNVCAAIAGIANWLTGGNYMFLAHKPVAASLLDFLGPWPWYIVSLEGVALVSYFVFYLPFLLVAWLEKKRGPVSK
ncbi:MAG TPA: TIGR02206 family membrane protein [Bacilli bacterium]|nr:TIGR02206 family membrane protein [Bacilli bacterium]